MQTTDWVIVGLGVVLARCGGLLLACASGRARFAATAAWRNLLEFCIIALAVGLVAAGGATLVPDVVTRSGTPLLLGTLLAASVLTSPAGERTRTRWAVATAGIYGLVVGPAAFFLGAWLIPVSFADVVVGLFPLTLAAAWVSLLAVWMAGPRAGRFHRDGAISLIPPHQQPLVLVGLLLLVAGWVCGWVLLSGGASTREAVHASVLSFAASLLAAAAYGRWRFGRLDIGLLVPGGVAGSLAGLSLAPALTETTSPLVLTLITVLAGGTAGVLAAWGHLQLERKLRIDDVVGSVTATGIGPLIGTLAAGLTLARGSGLLVALFAAAVYTAVAVPLTLGTLFLVRSIWNIRIDAAEEYEGLDLTQLDVNAYPDFQQPMIRSSHLREV